MIKKLAEYTNKKIQEYKNRKNTSNAIKSENTSDIKKPIQKINSEHNLTLSNLKALVFGNLVQFLGISVLLWLLIYLLNILVGISFGINQFADDVKSKLGIYFYIKDIPDQKDQIYSKLINMQQDLDANGISWKFYDKEVAYDTLNKKIPDIVKTFGKYGITNPLPATLYILVNDLPQYETTKKVIWKYQDIIINNEDINQNKSYQEQRQRVINIINLSDFVTILSYILVWFIIVLTIVFVLFIIRFKFASFRKIVEIEKLVWSSYRQIKKPFLIDVLLITVIWFLIGIWLIFATQVYIDWYISALFNTTVNQLTNITSYVYIYIFVEFIFLVLLIQLASNYFVHRLIKKI